MFYQEKSWIYKIINTISLYGLFGTLLRTLKAIIRISTSFTWERSLLLSKRINHVDFLSDKNTVIKEINILDYKVSGWEDFFTKQKEHIYRTRLAKDNYKAFGTYIDGKLAYTFWIIFGEMEVQNKFHYELDSSDSFILDIYCHPNFRNKGLHSYMTKWMLNYLYNKQMNRCFVTVYSYNGPSLKAFYKLGFITYSSFYLFKYGHTKKCTFKNI